MKTRKGWEKSNIILSDYLKKPCQIDEALHNYIGEIVTPQYNYDGIVQCGEAEYHDGYVLNYMTSRHINGKYFYLGILPEFHKPDYPITI
jgi:hypothetical protein